MHLFNKMSQLTFISPDDLKLDRLFNYDPLKEALNLISSYLLLNTNTLNELQLKVALLESIIHIRKAQTKNIQSRLTL